MSQTGPHINWIGQTIGGRYKIESLLGQGGMSSVYKATDPNLQRPVAIKLIHPHLSSDDQFVKRFEQEAQAVAQLRHPNIVQVFDFNHDNNMYYMVLEYVEGDTLQARLKALIDVHQVMPYGEAVQIMTTVAEAVAYAHEQNMIHRDLKPANVMINPRKQPILMDFGVAKMLGAAQHTATGAIIGTAKYMSPEQARGDNPDHRTDIYSLGVMLYEMVTGIPPFDAGSTVAILMKHVSEPLPDIHQINSSVPDSLITVIETALAKSRNDRYQSATEIAAALRAVIAPHISEPPDATVLQTSAASAPTSIAVTPATPARQPAKLGGFPMWLVGVAAVAIIAILGSGALFVFSPGSEEATPSAASGDPTAVAAAGTEKMPSAVGMTHIPAGTYTVGVDVSGDTYAPTQQIALSEFWIDQYEVTNAEFAKFVAATGQEAPADWSNGVFPAGEEKHPVDGVSWEVAVAYCRWLGKRLPTEAEWEITARGVEGRLFPWGNNQSVVPLPQSGAYPVGGKPTNQSPFGVFDMAGNVWEWVGEPYAPTEQGNQVLRGGANGFLQNMAYRLQGDPNIPTMKATAGFRCAASQVEVAQAEGVTENVLFSDTFGDPGSGWPILTEGNFLYGYHPPDFYHVQVSTTNDHTVVTRDPALQDFTVVTAVQTFGFNTDNGDFRYGLALRRSNEADYYAFVISPRLGRWAALKSSAAGLETLAEGEIASLKGIAPPGFSPDSNQIDILRVDAKGGSFILRINDEPIAQITDADYASGEIGFFAQNFDEDRSHIHFDSFTIQEVDFDDAVAAALAPAQGESAEPEPTEEIEPTATKETATTSDSVPAATSEPTAEATTEATAEATAEPTEEPAPENVRGFDVENMILIEPDFFQMGTDAGQSNEAPEHPVLFDGYYIDQFEVTNAQYRECVEAGGCTPAASANSFTMTGYRDDPAYDDYPVITVNWDQANAYCQWAAKRLPTEAEWEYAAAGKLEFKYPWGNDFDPAKSAASAKDAQPVGSYKDGASPFGLYDMAGNVAEWVFDTFSEDFYANSPFYNPVNTESGASRIFRGGSFDNPDGAFYTTTRRYINTRTFSEVDVGFRCAADSDRPASASLVAEFCALYGSYKPGGDCP
jgi:serine/threonine-protein kinase